jgi:putative nucleotidyltransferase with HDIG domain
MYCIPALEANIVNSAASAATLGLSGALLTADHPYFPRPADQIPFGDLLNGIFFDPLKDNADFPIRGPNVIRLARALLCGSLHEPGLIKGDFRAASLKFTHYAHRIQDALGVAAAPDPAHEMEKQRELLTAAALYHDIGKSIRRANHPLIGANLVQNFDEAQRRALVDVLVHPNEPLNTSARFNRFSLITSIIQHHDKFGVVSTGEGGLPIFSDILYFASGADRILGVKKNVTAVMLVNMADIAAVNTAEPPDRQRSLELAKEISQGRSSGNVSNESTLLTQLAEIIQSLRHVWGLHPTRCLVF